jgi:hypothetical protein
VSAASIFGIVTDNSGGVVPGVEVTLTEGETQQKRGHAQSDPNTSIPFAGNQIPTSRFDPLGSGLLIE